MADEAVSILSGETAKVRICDEKIYKWTEPCYKPIMTLEFEKIFAIEHTKDEGIHNCVYRVNENVFKDLSFLKGKLIKKFSSTRDDYSYQLRQYSDGSKFLFYSEEIPTFDSDDRVWDSMKYRAIYFDNEGINVLHCHEGYRLPRIYVCVGLQKATPEIIRWLAYIGCPSKKFPEIIK